MTAAPAPALAAAFFSISKQMARPILLIFPWNNLLSLFKAHALYASVIVVVLVGVFVFI